ncbi:MAG TPA: hypothetical protein VIN10_10085 [Bacteroidales bacterium]
MIKKEIKEQIVSGLPDHELRIFKIPIGEKDFSSLGIKWVEENEFIFEGKMYDVVKVKNVNNEKWFYCFEDHKESALVDKLNKLQNGLANNPIKKNSNNLLVHILTTPFEIQTLRTAANWALNDFEPIRYFFRIKDWSPSPASPPPKV